VSTELLYLHEACLRTSDAESEGKAKKRIRLEVTDG
jgi:hypothetical protein